MQDSIKVLSFPVLLAISLLGTAQAGDSAAPMSSARLYADAAAVVARDSQQFQNIEQADQLRHRVYEQFPEYADKTRAQYQTQQDKQAQHQYQYREQSSGQHMHQSGSPGRSSGMGGMGGGGGRGR